MIERPACGSDSTINVGGLRFRHCRKQLFRRGIDDLDLRCAGCLGPFAIYKELVGMLDDALGVHGRSPTKAVKGEPSQSRGWRSLSGLHVHMDDSQVFVFRTVDIMTDNSGIRFSSGKRLL